MGGEALPELRWSTLKAELLPRISILILATALSGCSAGSSKDLSFRDVSGESGISYVVNRDFDHHGDMPVMMESVVGGVAVGDVDNDGWLDFYVTDDGPNALYRNLGNGRFEEVSARMGARDDGNGRSALFLDYDRDGWQDLFIVNYQDPNRLLRNLQGRSFEDVTPLAGLGHSSGGHGAAASDVDRDGDLDIVVANYGDFHAGPPEYYAMANNGAPNFLYRNNGNGRFTEVGAASGLVDRRWSFQPAFADYDADGDQDLYVCNDFGLDVLYQNDGHGRFTDVSAPAGIRSDRNCMGVAWADYDGDGRLDVFVPNIFVPDTPVPANDGNFLWLGAGDGTFRDAAAAAGVEDSLWSWAPVAFDADNDRDVDLFVTNGMGTAGPLDGWYDADFHLVRSSEAAGLLPPAGFVRQGEPTAYNATHSMVRFLPVEGQTAQFMSMAGHQPDRFFVNDGKGRFQERAARVGLALETDGRSAAAFDYDRDGDLDLLATSRNASVQLFRNEARGNHWLQLWLRGAAGDPDAVGARVTVKAGGDVLIRERTAGDGFLSQASPVLHFGLASANRVDEILIRWPSGLEEVIRDVSADRLYRATEGEGRVVGLA